MTSAGSTGKQSVEKQIRSLEGAIRDNPIRHSNNIIELISYITTPTKNKQSKQSRTTKAIHATRRCLNLLQSNASSEKLQTWLFERSTDYANSLVRLLQSSEISHTLYDAAVASAALSPKPVFGILIQSILDHTLNPPITADAINLIHQSIRRFSDLSYITFDMLKQTIISNHKIEFSSHYLNLLYSASESPPYKDAKLTYAIQKKTANMSTSENESEDEKITLSSLRAVRTQAWQSILRHNHLTIDQRQSLISKLSTYLIPHMSKSPLELADFLTASYNSCSNYSFKNRQDERLLVSLSISSLDGLFILISKYNLDYPYFYHKLYTLLSSITFSLIHSHPKFFNLLSAFLIRGGQRTLSKSLASAFIKRLIRRSIHCSTASALFCIRLALELLRTYPATSYLVHNPPVNFFETDKDVLKAIQQDPFNDDEQNPDLCHVESSSLWELDMLRLHFSPNVSRLIGLFEIDMRTKPPPLPGDLSDYSALHFNDLMQAEMKRKAKAIHVAYDSPGSAAHSTNLESSLSPSISWS